MQITASFIDQLKLLPRLAFLCQIVLTLESLSMVYDFA